MIVDLEQKRIELQSKRIAEKINALDPGMAALVLPAFEEAERLGSNVPDLAGVKQKRNEFFGGSNETGS